MEKKYYFRGLGLGIVVTAVIMGIALSGGGGAEISDDEVIARAKELGMVQDSTLLEASEEENAEEGQEAAEQKEDPEQETSPEQKADPAQEASPEQKADQEQEISPAQEEEVPVVGAPESLEEKENRTANAGKSETDTEKPVDVGKKPAADTNEMTKPDEDVSKRGTETKPVTEAVKSVTIASGDGSYTVAKKLAEAGAVRSADAYDDFLCANGYDKKLRPGTFKIPSGANDEQIARIVTGQE